MRVRSLRIAVGGVQHETNTFAATRARFEDFVAADAWPGLTRGAPLIDAVRGINLPIAGFAEESLAAGHELVPLLWCAAQPSGPVTRDAFEAIASMLVEDVRANLPLDAIYLDLHGAMVAEHLDDADGELLARLQATAGEDVPIVGSLDLHANVSRAMVQTASLLVGYRTYPHVDMAETGARAARALPRIVGRAPLARAHRVLDFLIPLTSQCTLVEPMARLMQQAIAATQGAIVSLEFTPGFPLADVIDAGPCVFGYGEDATVRTAVEALASAIETSRQEFALRLWSVGDAVRHALETVRNASGPVILVDTQDNPGAGGNGDTMSILKALLAAGATSVLAGLICDEAAARAAHEAGVGRRLTTRLGSGSGSPGDSPLEAEFVVEALGDGHILGTGPFYRGTRMELGPMALLAVGGLRIAVASRKQQAADQAMFRHLGAEPSGAAILVLKSSVHFRADFGPLAREILLVEAPGPSPADPARLPWRKLRPAARPAPAQALYCGATKNA